MSITLYHVSRHECWIFLLFYYLHVCMCVGMGII